MGRFLWVATEILIFIGGLPILFGWFNLLTNPRKMADGMGWSIPKAIGMQALFSAIWFAVFAASYAIAVYVGVAT
jgi:hypothetical protein